MRNRSIIILSLFVTSIIGCEQKKSFNVTPFNRSVSLNEVNSIELVEIEHPMLGGIVNSNALDDSRVKEFLEDLENMRLDGPYIARTTFIIRMNLKNDTLRLKNNGNLIANREKDIYYNLTDNQNIIEKYWPVN